jgi:2-iminobutanoate/2-iminopropanoate deaminase
MSEKNLKRKSPFSNAKKVGNMIFVSGQIPKDPETGEWSDNIETQTTTVLRKIRNILEKHGASMADVVKTTVYLTDIRYFAQMNQTYVKFFEKHGNVEELPARSCVEVGRLMYHEWFIEMDCIAVISET